MEKIKLKMKYLKCLICIKNANPLTKIKRKGYHKDIKEVAVYYGENVPLFRRNGYQKSGAMIP